MGRFQAYIAILAAVACAQVKPPKPGFNIFSKQQDIQLGREAAAEVERKYTVIHDRELQEYVSNLGAKLARSRYASDFPYSFKVVADDSVNAFALPGGPMYIQTGLIKEVESEAQLAGVMSHEMSHVALRHGTNQASKANLVQMPLALAGGEGGGLLGSVVQSSVLLKFSRGAEAQADYNGVLIMSDAGYNPIELARYFERLEAQTAKESRLREFLSSHPNSGNRVQAIEALIPKLPPREYSDGDIQAFRRANEIVMKLPSAK